MVCRLAVPAALAACFVVALLAPSISAQPAFTTAVTTIAGQFADPGLLDGIGTAARVKDPFDMAYDQRMDELWFAGAGSWRMRKVDLPTKRVKTVIGNAAGSDVYGPFSVAGMPGPYMTYLETPTSCNMYISCPPQTIRRVDFSTSTVHPVVGGSAKGYQEGTGTAALFNIVSSAVILPSDTNTLHICDRYNHVLRALDLTTMTTRLMSGIPMVAGKQYGTNSTYYEPWGLRVRDDNRTMWLSDFINCVIRIYDPATKSSSHLAGQSQLCGTVDGTLLTAKFASPCPIRHHGDVIYVGQNYPAIRAIVDGYVISVTSNVAGAVDGTFATGRLRNTHFMEIDCDGNLYSDDYDNDAIRKITVTWQASVSLGKVPLCRPKHEVLSPCWSSTATPSLTDSKAPSKSTSASDASLSHSTSISEPKPQSSTKTMSRGHRLGTTTPTLAVPTPASSGSSSSMASSSAARSSAASSTAPSSSSVTVHASSQNSDVASAAPASSSDAGSSMTMLSMSSSSGATATRSSSTLDSNGASLPSSHAAASSSSASAPTSFPSSSLMPQSSTRQSSACSPSRLGSASSSVKSRLSSRMSSVASSSPRSPSSSSSSGRSDENTTANTAAAAGDDDESFASSPAGIALFVALGVLLLLLCCLLIAFLLWRRRKAKRQSNSNDEEFEAEAGQALVPVRGAKYTWKDEARKVLGDIEATGAHTQRDQGHGDESESTASAIDELLFTAPKTKTTTPSPAAQGPQGNARAASAPSASRSVASPSANVTSTSPPGSAPGLALFGSNATAASANRAPMSPAKGPSAPPKTTGRVSSNPLASGGSALNDSSMNTLGHGYALNDISPASPSTNSGVNPNQLLPSTNADGGKKNDDFSDSDGGGGDLLRGLVGSKPKLPRRKNSLEHLLDDDDDFDDDL